MTVDRFLYYTTIIKLIFVIRLLGPTTICIIIPTGHNGHDYAWRLAHIMPFGECKDDKHVLALTDDNSH